MIPSTMLTTEYLAKYALSILLHDFHCDRPSIDLSYMFSSLLCNTVFAGNTSSWSRTGQRNENVLSPTLVLLYDTWECSKCWKGGTTSSDPHWPSRLVAIKLGLLVVPFYIDTLLCYEALHPKLFSAALYSASWTFLVTFDWPLQLSRSSANPFS